MVVVGRRGRRSSSSSAHEGREQVVRAHATVRQQRRISQRHPQRSKINFGYGRPKIKDQLTPRSDDSSRRTASCPRRRWHSGKRSKIRLETRLQTTRDQRSRGRTDAARSDARYAWLSSSSEAGAPAIGASCGASCVCGAPSACGAGAVSHRCCGEATWAANGATTDPTRQKWAGRTTDCKAKIRDHKGQRSKIKDQIPKVIDQKARMNIILFVRAFNTVGNNLFV